jgi:hypothetical protein
MVKILKKNLMCGNCKGFGYVIKFKVGDIIQIRDCSYCDGKGEKEFLIDDKRKNSKNQTFDGIPSEF